MYFELNKKALLDALRIVAGVVESRHVVQILSHLLFVLEGKRLVITATNSEVQLTAQVQLENPVDTLWKTTMPGKKLLDICKVLPDLSILKLSTKAPNVQLSCGKTRFSLATLLADDFPLMAPMDAALTIEIERDALLFLLMRTYFSIAQHDVRYFLNGMLLNIQDKKITAVATDGHRLALNTALLVHPIDKPIAIIVPRKAVAELMRLVQSSAEEAVFRITMNPRCMCVQQANFSLTSNLVQGSYPDYSKIVPSGCNQSVMLNVQPFKQALTRVAILTNDKFRGVRVELLPGQMIILVNNPEQEQAEETLEVDYQGDKIALGFNVNYLLDVLGVVLTEQITLRFLNAQKSVLLEEVAPHVPDRKSVFVIMPLTL